MQNDALGAGRPPIPFWCLPQLLKYQAEHIPDAPAILAPGRAPLTYRFLYQHIQNAGHNLRAMGIGRHDRVAVSLPDCPELPVVLLAVAASAICAPLNPAYQAEELERYFGELRPRALITRAKSDSPARRVALSRGLRIVELSTAPDAEAGLFTLAGNEEAIATDQLVSPDHVAVLLPTSGTTSRPKIVPQTHANICASAFSSVAALALKQSDRCLNVVPLFHGHGLHATVVTTLAAGASVVSTPGFDAKNFCAWLTAFQPTWYSAVPTMHQAILAQAMQIRERMADCRLRFIRSSSAPLPPRLFTELERTFETPVIEYYGMAEVAASPIACNPLPPRKRKRGSVGVPVGLDVAIMDEKGTLLPMGGAGEVVVRGPSVVSGYYGDPIATNAAFADGWFKTGDLGYFDEDRYLFLVGRAREFINRGGDKIAPREVDEVLLEHPAVAEAVTFAARHPTLGEDVAAALVLRPHSKATAKDIRQFAKARLAPFKIPRQVLFVKNIPKGPTGKVKRVGLAAELGLESAATPIVIAPRTPIEKMLAECWMEALGLEQVGIHDDFFVLGGDSLMAAHLLTSISENLHLEIEASRFFDGPTVAEFALYIECLLAPGQAAGLSLGIIRMPRQNGAVLTSIAQERLWKLQHALPNIPLFNVLYALRLNSPLDVAVLERSINEIVRRHEILRTSFALIDNECRQVVAPQLTIPLTLHDLQALPHSKKETIGHKVVQGEMIHSFDLAKGPLVRTCLVRLAEREHVLLISMHHAVCDGWSLGVFVEELVILYDAFFAQKESPLAPLSIQYADFAHWQRNWQSHPEIEAQLVYWQEQLRDPLPSMQLVASRPKRTVDNLRTVRREWALPLKLWEAAKHLSHQEGGTLFMALVATLKMLLHHYLGEDDVRVATNVANRNRPGANGLIGPLVNTVILRTNLAGNPTAREVIRRVRATCLAAFANQDLPFEQVAESIDRERGLKLPALASIMILLQNDTLRPLRGDRSKLTFEEANANTLMPPVTLTTFDVMITLRENSNGLVGTCAYKPELFTARTINCLLRDFEGVLDQMVLRPTRTISTIRVSLNVGAHHLKATF